MTAALSAVPPAGGWTTDDLDSLPEDGFRRELLDGVLLVSPSPTDIHQIIAMRLGVALEDSCPAEFQVYAPHEVVLAVEIVSPTSQSMDRITKPALYAAAAIPYYWRIETDGGISVHTYKIDPESEMYRPFGTFDVEIDTVEPWPIKLPIAKLTPRYL
jgi:Uma2 family endonuclease